MHILVLQHAKVEHPGAFRKFLREDGHEWTAIELDEGERMPELDGFDALWVLGGPMDVWQETEHRWLREEKRLVRDAVERRGMPFLGLCLGHQLLAEALGGHCGKAERPEVGVMDVELTKIGMESVFFDSVPEEFKCLQWHGAEVKRLPDGAVVLATSPACAVQAMSWGPRAFSVQFHVEVEPDTVRDWAEIPEYHSALRDAFGDDGVSRLAARCDSHMQNFASVAERVYMNWMHAAQA